jgi:hypothetical protein
MLVFPTEAANALIGRALRLEDFYEYSNSTDWIRAAWICCSLRVTLNISSIKNRTIGHGFDQAITQYVEGQAIRLHV